MTKKLHLSLMSRNHVKCSNNSFVQTICKSFIQAFHLFFEPASILFISNCGHGWDKFLISALHREKFTEQEPKWNIQRTYEQRLWEQSTNVLTWILWWACNGLSSDRSAVHACIECECLIRPCVLQEIVNKVHFYLATKSNFKIKAWYWEVMHYLSLIQDYIYIWKFPTKSKFQQTCHNTSPLCQVSSNLRDTHAT